MDLAWDLLGFAAKSAMVFLTVVGTTFAVLVLVRRARLGASTGRGWLEVKNLNERFENLRDALKLGTARGRAALKALKGQQKALARASSEAGASKPSVYVLDFDGDVLATATANLREEVTAITEVAKPDDEVVVRLESGGGAVPHYGLAAAQLVRLKERQLRVTVCIDRVAASGGYLMACVADRVVAAPFSIIGSIGVVAQVPNLHRFLKNRDVDVEEMTAGEFKRTVSLLGEVTDKGRAKLKAQLEETHGLFKAFVQQYRPALDIDAVATGEYWLGSRARELKLVDALSTSDEYLVRRAKEANVFRVRYHGPNPWRERLAGAAGELLERVLFRLQRRVEEARFQ